MSSLFADIFHTRCSLQNSGKFCQFKGEVYTKEFMHKNKIRGENVYLNAILGICTMRLYWTKLRWTRLEVKLNWSLDHSSWHVGWLESIDLGMGLGVEKWGATGLKRTNCQTIKTIWGKRFLIKKTFLTKFILDLLKKSRCNESSKILWQQHFEIDLFTQIGILNKVLNWKFVKSNFKIKILVCAPSCNKGSF